MISWFQGCGLCSGAVDAVGAVGAVATAPAAAAVGVVVVVVLLFILIDLPVLNLVLVVGGYLEVATFWQKYQLWNEAWQWGLSLSIVLLGKTGRASPCYGYTQLQSSRPEALLGRIFSVMVSEFCYFPLVYAWWSESTNQQIWELTFTKRSFSTHRANSSELARSHY